MTSDRAAALYDERYEGGYRSALYGFEFARWSALKHFITSVAECSGARRVVDYGSGRGLFVPLWQEVFPDAELWFCDVSPVALTKLATDHQRHASRTRQVVDNRADLPDGFCDVVVSIEVLEHVADLRQYLQDIRRVLRPGGTFVWTTPCANALSIEHVVAVVIGQVDSTAEGYRRWRWEDPTHVRRMKTKELRQVLAETGFKHATFRLRSHFFSHFVTEWLPRLRPYKLRAYLRNREKGLLELDYRYLRMLPNGASMLGAATKPATKATASSPRKLGERG